MPHKFRAHLEQLHAQFVAGLPERAQQIEALWQQLTQAWTQPTVEGLHLLVHRLVGSGSSYGFPELSGGAQQIEFFLQQHKAAVTQEEREQLDQLVVALVRELRQAQLKTVATSAPVNLEEGQGKRVYIVDDDRALSALIAAYLRSSGFNVEQFESPTVCIQHLDTYPPQAIVMDLGFQGESVQGLEAVEHIKIQLGNSVPIVLLSARKDMQARLRALRAGCANYLTKPVDFYRLVNTLNMAISHYQTNSKVLVVDDDELVARHHAEILRYAGMDVQIVTQPLQTLQQTAIFRPDLVVLDMHMPDINGVELATLLRQDEEFVVLPIIFITADTSQDVRNSIESLGVNGLLHKPVDGRQLVALANRALKETLGLKNRIAQVTQRAGRAQQITRSYFLGAIDTELQQQYLREQSHKDERIALYYLGVDNLENIYEQYGQTGLVQLHEQFCQRVADVLGTDEQWSDMANLVVCVLTDNKNNMGHQERAEQIVASLGDEDYELDDGFIKLLVSAGISYIDNEFGSANSVLLHAERAYEKARGGAGKGSSEYVAPISPAVNLDEVADFSQGFSGDNLAISYQAMISLEHQKVEHHEALVRWRNTSGELVPAGRFLRHIENSAMRVELDRWVLQTAVNTVVNDSLTRESASLFIHLSEQTLQQKSFFAFAANVLRSSRLRGERRLVFMLSENWVNSEAAQARIIINALRDINCGVCLTQAGSTPNSEDLINHYKFDFIKLAPELTAKLQGESLVELQRIAELAKSSGAKVIATQVEDAKNLTKLWLYGVRLFQGFFIQVPEQQLVTETQLEFYEAGQKTF